MKLFIDTNVIMDLVENRTPFAHSASRIIHLGTTREHELFASDLTFANVVYMSRKYMQYPVLIQMLSELRDVISVAGIGAAGIDFALAQNNRDFEDTLQYFSAKQIHADCIITRDKKDFAFPDIPVYTPDEFLGLTDSASR